MLLVLVAALAACALASRAPSGDAEHTAVIRVEAGESLWSLAKAHPVAGLSTAQTVQLIADLNSLDERTLWVGSSIRVPAAPTNDVASR